MISRLILLFSNRYIKCNEPKRELKIGIALIDFAE